eukprot:COSAG03_NODE_39_length_17408_cov_16.363972_4_plen_61_part_00
MSSGERAPRRVTSMTPATACSGTRGQGEHERWSCSSRPGLVLQGMRLVSRRSSGELLQGR